MLRPPTQSPRQRRTHDVRTPPARDHRQHVRSQPHVESPTLEHSTFQHPRSALALQRTIGNRAVRQMLQRDDTDTDTPPRAKTLYMGMNPTARGEAKSLKGILKDEVILAMNDPALEKSLETDAGIATWLLNELPTLIGDPWQYLFAFEAVRQSAPAARDQMAQVIKMFHAAERGEFRLERLVLSGHSNGVQLWGDEEKNFNPGSFVLDDAMTRLTNAFPKASAQVEDVMFSACYTLSSIELVTRVFPNVRTVWGYAGTSPAGGAGAERHIAKWEKETRGAKTLQADDGLGKSALWTRDAAEASAKKNGYIRNDPAKANLKTLFASFWGLSNDALEQFKGNTDINQNILNQAYFHVQMMLAHPDLKDDDRATLVRWRDMLLRFRHYEKISANFATTYAAEIKKGYAAIKRAVPNYARLSRAALRAEKEAFEAALAAAADAEAQAFYTNYLNPFWKMDINLIPETWI